MANGVQSVGGQSTPEGEFLVTASGERVGTAFVRNRSFATGEGALKANLRDRGFSFTGNFKNLRYRGGRVIVSNNKIVGFEDPETQQTIAFQQSIALNERGFRGFESKVQQRRTQIQEQSRAAEERALALKRMEQEKQAKQNAQTQQEGLVRAPTPEEQFTGRRSGRTFFDISASPTDRILQKTLGVSSREFTKGSRTFGAPSKDNPTLRLTEQFVASGGPIGFTLFRAFESSPLAAPIQKAGFKSQIIEAETISRGEQPSLTRQIASDVVGTPEGRSVGFGIATAGVTAGAKKASQAALKKFGTREALVTSINVQTPTSVTTPKGTKITQTATTGKGEVFTSLPKIGGAQKRIAALRPETTPFRFDASNVQRVPRSNTIKITEGETTSITATGRSRGNIRVESPNEIISGRTRSVDVGTSVKPSTGREEFTSLSFSELRTSTKSEGFVTGGKGTQSLRIEGEGTIFNTQSLSKSISPTGKIIGGSSSKGQFARFETGFRPAGEGASEFVSPNLDSFTRISKRGPLDFGSQIDTQTSRLASELKPLSRTSSPRLIGGSSQSLIVGRPNIITKPQEAAQIFDEKQITSELSKLEGSSSTPLGFTGTAGLPKERSSSLENQLIIGDVTTQPPLRETQRSFDTSIPRIIFGPERGPTFSFGFPPLLPPLPSGGSSNVNNFNPKRKKTQRGFTPTLFSTLLDISGPRDPFGEISGLGIRPLPKKRRKK